MAALEKLNIEDLVRFYKETLSQIKDEMFENMNVSFLYQQRNEKPGAMHALIEKLKNYFKKHAEEADFYSACLKIAEKSMTMNFFVDSRFENIDELVKTYEQMEQ